jgi:hypothetical protein
MRWPLWRSVPHCPRSSRSIGSAHRWAVCRVRKATSTLLCVSDAPLDTDVRFDLQERVALALRRTVDLVDLRAASPVMAIQVIAKGVLLYDGDAGPRGHFEDFVYGAHARLNEERKGILDRIAAEGTVYGR